MNNYSWGEIYENLFPDIDLPPVFAPNAKLIAVDGTVIVCDEVKSLDEYEKFFHIWDGDKWIIS